MPTQVGRQLMKHGRRVRKPGIDCVHQHGAKLRILDFNQHATSLGMQITIKAGRVVNRPDLVEGVKNRAAIPCVGADSAIQALSHIV